MASIKLIYNILDAIFGGFLGLIIFDIFQTPTGDLLSDLDGWIKVIMAIIGLIYFPVKLVLEWRSKTLDNKIKREDIKKKRLENAHLKRIDEAESEEE